MPHFHRNYPYLLVSIFLTAEDGLAWKWLCPAGIIPLPRLDQTSGNGLTGAA
jgi:hypothetical protein